MRKTFFLSLIFITLLSLACNFSFSTANIGQAQLAKDPEGTQVTTVFDQDDIFYALISLENAPDDTTLKAVWTAVEVEDVEPNFVLDENAITSGDSSIEFSLTNDNPWLPGKYKVDLYLNDELNRTLEFTVEADEVAQAPSATPEPTDTPEPTATPAPTQTPANTASDSLAIASTEEPIAEPIEEATEEATQEATAEEFEPLPLQAEPYAHPSGAFTFAIPENWELQHEDETSASFSDGQTYLGAVFTDGQIVYDETDMQNYIDLFTEDYLSGFAQDYEIIEQQVQADDSIYLALSYTTADGGAGDADFFFEQRDTIVFVFVFDTPVYQELQPTWNEIIATYAVDAEAALASLPAPAAAPQPVPPTPTPEPVEINPFVPPAGGSRLYVFNEFNQELTFTIDNKEHKIPPAGIDHPVPIDLNPGRYTYTISIPGGAANGEVTLAVDQSWAVGVRGDGAVYEPFQVYP